MVEKVVTAEEIDALMRGLAAETGTEHPAVPGAATLRPGDRLTLAPNLPTLRSIGPSPWHTVSRPIENWPERRLAELAPSPGVFHRPQTRPFKATGQSIDFWPAYADALTNLVLQLLLLVGVITMGLVVVNREVIEQQLRLAQLRVSASNASRAQTSEPHPLAAPQPAAVAPPRASDPPDSPASPFDPDGPVATSSISRADPEGPPPRRFTIRPSPAASGQLAGNVTAEAAAERLAGAAARPGGAVRHTLKLTFDLRETAWPEDRALDGAEALDPRDRRALVVFAPTDNRRLMTEAFNRLMSVRNRMIADGVPPANIVLRLAPVPDDIEGDVTAARTLYVVNLGRE
jgi:hypothetical protein